MVVAFISWIALSFVAGFIGSNRKIGFGWCLFWALLLSPLVGFIIALSSEKLSDIEFKKQTLEALNSQQTTPKETPTKTSCSKPQATDSNPITEAVIKITGISTLGEQTIKYINYLDPSKKIYLIFEKDSQFNPNDISIMVVTEDYKHIGYIPKDKNLQIKNSLKIPGAYFMVSISDFVYDEKNPELYIKITKALFIDEDEERSYKTQLHVINFKVKENKKQEDFI